MAKGHKRPRSRRNRDQLGRCQDCPTDLTPDNWHESNRKRKRYICKSCYNKRQRAYEANNPETKRQANNRWAMENRTRVYGYYIKRQYGITLAEYDIMLARQGGGCGICKGGTKGRGRFHVDHCHETGQVRGLLCAKCNILLGHANDDTKLLRAAIGYLIDPPNG